MIVSDESIDSSSIYRSKREGIAIWIRITAGTIVQIHSIICLSSKFLLINVLNIILTIM